MLMHIVGCVGVPQHLVQQIILKLYVHEYNGLTEKGCLFNLQV